MSSPFRSYVLAFALVAANAGSASAEPLLIAEGDSLTYGQDPTKPSDGLPPINQAHNPRSATPYPETLQLLVGSKYKVVNEGFPGDRTVDALGRWPSKQPAKMTVIMFGTNDALNFGKRPSGPLTLSQFDANLRELVQRAKKSGSTVILMTPPPIGWAEGDAKLVPYRNIVQKVADDTGSQLIDTVPVLRSVNPLWTDKVHLSEAGYRALAGAVNIALTTPPQARPR